MFIGHYGASFLAKSLDRRIPLWLLFIATQFVDVVWAILVLLGIEKVRIVPGITASFPLDLYYMPYTHSLVAATIWAAFAFIAYRALGPSGPRTRAATIVGLVVFSHWVLDLVVHRPDLPLYDNSYKMGFGLWNHRGAAFVVESALLLGGVLLYFRSIAVTRPKSLPTRVGMMVFVLVLIALHVVVLMGPPPPSPSAAAVTFLVLYFALAAAAVWLGRERMDAGGIATEEPY